MKKLKYLLLMLVAIGVDQLTKQWALHSFSDGSEFTIIPKVLKFVYHENDGAAWGSFSGQATFLTLLTAVAVCAMIFMFFRLPAGKRYTPLRVLLVFLASGAMGNNLIDRVIYGHVIDFIYFELIDFPVFNVADMYIVISVAVFACLILFFYKEDELEFFKKKNKEVSGDHKIDQAEHQNQK